MMYSLNKSTFIKVRQAPQKWPYANQVIQQIRGILALRKESYQLGFWLSAMEDLQLDAILDALKQVKTMPDFNLDKSSPHVASEVDDILVSILIGLCGEQKSTDVALNPELMAAQLKSFHKACLLEKMTRQGRAYQKGYYRALSKDCDNYQLVNPIGS